MRISGWPLRTSLPVVTFSTAFHEGFRTQRNHRDTTLIELNGSRRAHRLGR